MIKRIFLYTFFGLMAVLNVTAQSTQQPALVVGIMVDGLQQKHLDMLWSAFDTNGFKRLGKGAAIRNMQFNMLSAGNASDIASALTGSIPFYHGVTANSFYSRKHAELRSVILDPAHTGVGTSQTVSPRNLLVSTLVDELMMTYPNQSKSFAVGIHPEDVLMLGGHTANAVAWIDDVQQRWVSTTYYKNALPKQAADMNSAGTFKTIASQKWEPLFAPKTYVSGRNSNSVKSFEYTPTAPTQRNSQKTILKSTPAANSLVSELALRIIADEKMGRDVYPDIMMMQFSVRTPNEKVFSLQSIEKEDMYLRLDKELQYFFQKLDAQIGMANVLVVMFGNQQSTHSPNELGENGISAGYFNADRSLALVNTYLMAFYGQEKWIEGYYGRNIFLNKKKIDEKKLNFETIQQQVAAFMLEFEGVHSAFTSTQILNNSSASNTEMARIRNSVHKNTVGDVVLTLLPGWIEVDNKYNAVGESNNVISTTPVYFYGWKIKEQQIMGDYQITDIAPSISNILNIPLPNASIGKPIIELFK